MVAPIIIGAIAVTIVGLGSGLWGYISGSRTVTEAVESASTAGGTSSFLGSFLGGSLGTTLLYIAIGFLIVKLVLKYLK